MPLITSDSVMVYTQYGPFNADWCVGDLMVLGCRVWDRELFLGLIFITFFPSIPLCRSNAMIELDGGEERVVLWP